MKLHLPVRLFKSVLVCLAAVASFSLGSGVAWAEAQNLIFNGTTLTWDTSEDNTPFVDEEGAAASFAAGDNVSFTGESTVTLGENITVGSLDIAAGADVTIDLGEYTLHTDIISLSGTLDVGDSLSIGSGSTLAVQNDAAVLDSALVLGEKSGLVVESAASLNNNDLTLQGGSSLILTAAGDGKTYTLLTDISALLDKNGNTLTAGSYSINEYFDKDAPGSGFWADASLEYTADGTLQIVRHEENVQEPLTFSTRQTSNLEYNYYEGISFKDIVYSTTSSSAYGGAIYGVGTITLNNNGRVTFSGNTVSNSDAVYGGAIYGDYGTITLSNNGSVVFVGNTASSSSYSYFHPARGGAIYGNTIMLSNNGSVVFAGNMASSSSSFPFSTASTSPSAYGGAIYGDTIMLSNNGSVVFEGNTVSATFDPDSCPNTLYAYGCAICGGDNSTIELSNNGCVQFRGNSTTTSDSNSGHSCGGAIYGGDNSSIKLSNNGRV